MTQEQIRPRHPIQDTTHRPSERPTHLPRIAAVVRVAVSAATWREAMTSPVGLDTESRARAGNRLATKEFDVLVVGGGVTGAGVALDAATRGLSTALVEQRDFASGTSSRSSKLFHGGLRYLEQMNFDLVREALKERELMLSRIAPHLVKPVSFLYPLTGRGWERPYVSAGLTLYDTMGGSRSVPRHKQLTRTGALKLAPALRRGALTGGLLYYHPPAGEARPTLTTGRPPGPTRAPPAA